MVIFHTVLRRASCSGADALRRMIVSAFPCGC